jgi:hypothetical protein
MVLLVFELQDTLERARLVDALRSKRMSALDETEDLMWKSGYFLVFLDFLENLGEAARLEGRSGPDGCRPICEATEDGVDGRCVAFNLECQSQ